MTTGFHSTRYVDSLMRAEGLPSTGHDIGDRFQIEQVVELAPGEPYTLRRVIG